MATVPLGILLWLLIQGVFYLVRSRSSDERRRTALHARLAAIADRLRGGIEDSPRHEHPLVRFQRNRIPGSLAIRASASGMESATLELWNGGGGFFEAAYRRVPRRAQRLSRSAPIPPPSNLSEFRLHATTPDWGQQLLDHGVRPLLTSVRRWARAPFELQSTPARLSIQVDRRVEPADADRMLRFLEELRRLSIHVPDPRGIVLLAAQVESAGGRCPVCGLSLMEGVVACGSCRTPHHADCWEYAERCSIFGCGSRRTA